MKVLVTGANGFVGSYVVKQLLEAGYEVFASSRNADLCCYNTSAHYHFIQMDFTDPFALHDAFEFVQPDVVVHSGAMSKPDECEGNPAEAYDTNVWGTVQLLLNAATYKSFFILLSTDFIFNGNEGMYKEDALPDPISYYGKTKQAAEDAVQDYAYDWAVVRTVFVYGKPIAGRSCFFNWVEKKLSDNESIKIVNDQHRTPTYVVDLAKAIAAIVAKKAKGIFHIAGEEVLTPYQMALQTAAMLGYAAHQLIPVTRKEFTEPATRPLKGGLNIEKAKQVLEYQPTPFEEGLKATLFG